MKNTVSFGYSGGRGGVGLDPNTAPRELLFKAAIGLGCTTVTSVIAPSLWTLNVTTTRPLADFTNSETAQLRLICVMKLRTQGVNSTPAVSNRMSGPNGEVGAVCAGSGVPLCSELGIAWTV